MATADAPVLFVAAESREFDGLIQQIGSSNSLDWPGAAFSREIMVNGARWWLIANGPGSALVNRMLANRRNVNEMVSTGFCGALDPTLKVGDIVISGDAPQTKLPFIRGGLHTSDRVVVTAQEKQRLRASTQAVAVDMEASAVAEKAREWGVPFRYVRVVSDTAKEDLPLDFNSFRDPQGRFSRGRIAAAAILRPRTAIPALLRLDKNCRRASQKLGVFLADCRF
jgi:adenosylhomocysteine nucleosidase